MHVAFISTSCVAVPPARYGGTELVIAELARALVARGHRVTTYATGDSRPAGELRALFPRAVWPPDPHMDLLQAHFACCDLLARAPRPDVVHAHSGAALAFARFLDVPVVYTVHHAREANLVEYYRYFARTEYVMISRRQSALHAEVPNRNVVHHGLDPARYRPGRGDGGYVAYLGRFAPEKGSHVAIDVAGRAGVPIVLAGDAHPPERAFFAREMAPRLARRGVFWGGEADHAAKQDLLGGARALLFPIDWEEPFGLVIIEAMLCGTPVVAFRRGSVPELVDHGVTGFVVDTPDEMVDAIRAVGALDRHAVRRHAQLRWSADRMARQYLDVYAACVRRHREQADRPSYTSLSPG